MLSFLNHMTPVASQELLDREPIAVLTHPELKAVMDTMIALASRYKSQFRFWSAESSDEHGIHTWVSKRFTVTAIGFTQEEVDEETPYMRAHCRFGNVSDADVLWYVKGSDLAPLAPQLLDLRVTHPNVEIGVNTVDTIYNGDSKYSTYESENLKELQGHRILTVFSQVDKQGVLWIIKGRM